MCVKLQTFISYAFSRKRWKEAVTFKVKAEINTDLIQTPDHTCLSFLTVKPQHIVGCQMLSHDLETHLRLVNFKVVFQSTVESRFNEPPI